MFIHVLTCPPKCPQSFQFNRFSRLWFGMLILMVFQSSLYSIPKSLFPRRMVIVWIPKVPLSEHTVLCHKGAQQDPQLLGARWSAHFCRYFKSHLILNYLHKLKHNNAYYGVISQLLFPRVWKQSTLLYSNHLYIISFNFYNRPL